MALPPATSGWIGLDESGKGDYFGPLVVAAVYVTPEQAASLTALGVRDSKRLTDLRATTLAAAVRQQAVVEVVKINPARYNSLYAKIKNLNRLLAWAHARALENLLGRVTCERAVIDQFAQPELIERTLMAAGKKIRVEQRHRAEEDAAVAAASVVARAEFLAGLQALSTQIGMTLPKGASDQVVRVAQRLVATKGMTQLEQVAKVHFQITKRLMSAT
ncbi:MAG: ribonuclease HIII [Nitrospirota bacterium]